MQAYNQKRIDKSAFTAMQSDILQRKCACGQHTLAGGHCSECRKKNQVFGGRASHQADASEVLSANVDELLIDSHLTNNTIRILTDSSFPRDFSRVPVHNASPTKVQPKLKINQPGDKYEQEADRVAELVMCMPDNGVEGISNSPQTAQRSKFSSTTPSATPLITSQINELRSGGQSLSEGTRSFFDRRFGTNFSGVRVHTNDHAADTARSVGAKAFTLGNDIVFGAGEYTPNTNQGKRLLAHELTHVIQQSSQAELNMRSSQYSQENNSHLNFTHDPGATTIRRQSDPAKARRLGLTQSGLSFGDRRRSSPMAELSLGTSRACQPSSGDATVKSVKHGFNDLPGGLQKVLWQTARNQQPPTSGNVYFIALGDKGRRILIFVYNRMIDYGLWCNVSAVQKVDQKGSGSVEFIYADTKTLLGQLRSVDANFCWDNINLLHPGKTCFRELTRDDGIHICIESGGKFDAHIDRYSPGYQYLPGKTCLPDPRMAATHIGREAFGDVTQKIIERGIDRLLSFIVRLITFGKVDENIPLVKGLLQLITLGDSESITRWQLFPDQPLHQTGAQERGLVPMDVLTERTLSPQLIRFIERRFEWGGG